MTEKNQKKLYVHFKKLSKDGVNDKQRTECARYAAEILKSFPQFEIKEKVKAEAKPPVKETKSNKEK